MKKLISMTVLIMITTVGLSDEYSYERVRYFSNHEIANLLPNIAKVNPHIPDLNWIYPGEILNIPLDSTIIPIYVKWGDNTTKILSCGIPEMRIADAKFIYASTKSGMGVLATTDTTVKMRQPIPTYIWWDILGICSLFIFTAFIYIKLKKAIK